MKTLTCWLAAFGLVGSVVFAAPASAATGSEVGEAGDLPATAQDVSTTESLTSISGSVSSGNDRDMFKVCLEGGKTFSASTVGGASFDTQLFLFDSTGRGVYADDDLPTSEFQSILPAGDGLTPSAAGVYYLAISGWNSDPVSDSGLIFSGDIQHPLNDDPITGWSPYSGSQRGPYTIALTGTCGNEVAPPTLSGPPSASGAVGDAFTYAPTTLSGEPDPVVSVRPNANWPDDLPDGLVLDGDTGKITGTPADDAVGVYKVRLRAHNSSGKDVLKVTITIEKGTFGFTLDPTIQGVAQVGQTLTASPRVLVPFGTQVAYQWSADGVPIATGTGTSYTVQKSDLFKQITLTATATRVGYHTQTATSAATDPVHWAYLFPELSVTPERVHRGQQAMVSGVGFEPGSQYQISFGGGFFGGGTTVAWVTADEYGEITGKFRVPWDAAFGPAVVKAGSGFFSPSASVMVTSGGPTPMPTSTPTPG